MSEAVSRSATADSAPRRRRFGANGLVGGLIATGLIVVAGLFLLVARGCACSEPTPTLPPSPVDGVVVSVDAASLGEVRGFALRTRNGVVYTLKLGNLQDATTFSPSHLAEHQATSAPIRAWYVLEDGTPVVFRLEDAPG